MTKAKSKAPTSSVVNRHLYSRVNYLYQAAKYLETASQRSGQSKNSKGSGNARNLSNQLHVVALKGQIRVAPSLKNSICRRCESTQEEGISMRTYVENHSKNGSKPWADVLVHECQVCGAKKRFPIGATRQLRRKDRSVNQKEDQEVLDPKIASENGP